MFRKMLAIILCALCLAGCGGGSGGGSKNEGNPKKEVQALHEKYLMNIDKAKRESLSMAFAVEDLSQEMLDISQQNKSKFEAIGVELEKEKVSSKSEAYKTALVSYNNMWIKLWDITAKQCKLHVEGASSAEFDEYKQKARQELGNMGQIEYELENEYSKIIKGKPAIVMGVDGVNYLAYSASKVDIAITKVREGEGAIGSNPFLQQEPMGKFVIVSAYVKNNQKDAITVDFNSFKLIDNDGREYSSSPEGHVALAMEQGSKAKGMMTRLNPNMGTAFSFVFDVPKELSLFDVAFQARGGMTGDSVRIPLRPIKIDTIKE